MFAIKVNVGGIDFDIKQDFIDKHPESIFAKSIELIGKQDDERICFDRSSKYFILMLEFHQNRSAIKFSQMSHIDIRKLLIEAKYFGIEPMVEKCEKELTIFHQASIEIVKTEKKLKNMLTNESRLVIIVDYDCLRPNEGDVVQRALRLVDRDRCLVISCRETIGWYKRDYRSKSGDHLIYPYLLYDPKVQRVIRSSEPSDLGKLLVSIYYTETLSNNLITDMAHMIQSNVDENIIEEYFENFTLMSMRYIWRYKFRAIMSIYAVSFLCKKMNVI